MLPTVTGFAARETIAALRKRGVPVDPLLHLVELSESDLSGDDNATRVTAIAQAKLLDLAAEATGDSAFGLHVAEESDPRDAGIFFYVVSGAENFGEALALFARYFRIVNEAVRLKLRRTAERLTAEVEFVGLPRHEVRQNAEFGIAAILKALREVAGRNIRPTRAVFAHARNSELREFERFYLCPVEFGRATSDGVSSDLLEFSGDTLAIPLITADPKLLNALRPFCDLAASERNTRAGTLSLAVEREVEKLLPHGKAKAQTVAKNLALSVRSLSRRLALSCRGKPCAQVRRRLGCARSCLLLKARKHAQDYRAPRDRRSGGAH
jgi:hypothetical protein